MTDDRAQRAVFLGPQRALSLAIACRVGRRVAARTSAPILCLDGLAPPGPPPGPRPGPAGPPARLSLIHAAFDVTAPGHSPGQSRGRVLILEADNIDPGTLGLLRPYLADPATTVFAAAVTEGALQAAGFGEYLEDAPRYHCRLAGKPDGRPVLLPVRTR